MANHRIAGTLYIKVDGRQIPLKGSWNSQPGGFKRGGIAGQDGVHGYKEEPTVPTIEGDALYTRDVLLEDLERLDDVTVVAELANGRVHVYRNAWRSGDPLKTNTQEGTFPLKFEAMSGDEQ